MKKFVFVLSVLVFTFGFLFINNALATTMAYNNEAAWLGAVGASTVFTEDFNGIGADTAIGNYADSASTVVNGDFSLQELGVEVPGGNFIDVFPLEAGSLAPNTTSYVRAATRDDAISGSSTQRVRLRFIFNTDINFFGADFANLGPVSIEFATATSTAFPLDGDVVPFIDQSTGFHGIYSDVAFSVLYLEVAGWDGSGPNSGGDGFGFDNVRYGAASVPEPTTLLLLGTGLIGLAGLSRKKFFKK